MLSMQSTTHCKWNILLSVCNFLWHQTLGLTLHCKVRTYQNVLSRWCRTYSNLSGYLVEFKRKSEEWKSFLKEMLKVCPLCIAMVIGCLIWSIILHNTAPVGWTEGNKKRQKSLWFLVKSYKSHGCIPSYAMQKTFFPDWINEYRMHRLTNIGCPSIWIFMVQFLLESEMKNVQGTLNWINHNWIPFRNWHRGTSITLKLLYLFTEIF